ncbi:hypothetical protein SLA2020_475330 [Shorea laevis]
MEQARCWMWTKRGHSLSSNPQAAYGDSWEEKAFAEDASGPLGGCIWPPRSYSCSFCRREFRSAQALGGHMNVHRRDRARLKETPSPQSEILQQNIQDHRNHLTPNPFASGFQHPYSQVCNLVYNPNPNSESSPSRIAAASLPSKDNCSYQQTLIPSFSSTILQEHQKKSSPPPPKLWSNLVADRYDRFSDLMKSEGEKDLRILESGCKTDYVRTDLSVSLNLVLRQTRSTESGGDEEEIVDCKRRRTDALSLPFFLKPISIDKHQLQPEVIDLSHSSSDELDLELRLGGCCPKVK